jgi:aminoglycoside/choline kinase family phosphotransferase
MTPTRNDLSQLHEISEGLCRSSDDGKALLSGTGFSGWSLEKMPGDASTRRYYRAQSKSGFRAVIMRVEPFDNLGAHYPFLAVQDHLKGCGVDVPRVLDHQAKAGFVLLEDLGDITLLRKLQDVSDMQVERSYYERAIDVLVDLHVRATEKPAQSKLEAFQLRFDLEKLMWEVQFTVENFYELHLNRKISAGDRTTIQNCFTEICGALAAEPVVFTHRDYHSRNLMVTPGENGGDRFVMIDFQDARMGPAQYDLASLLRDSYYQLEETQIQTLLDYYIARVQALRGDVIPRAHFQRMFDLMCVQRNFKAIGSFASFQNKRGISTYLKYIGNTFENIRRVLLRYPEYSRLREVLFHYYYF